MVKLSFSHTFKTWLRMRTFNKKGWHFSEVRLGMYAGEYDDWEKYYLPISVTGLTVLDVGAGEGETALFFLEHGAKGVICIEPHYASYLRLRENAKDKPIVCLNKRFSLKDLNLPFDFMKMDIEGYEEILLSAQFDKPCAVEVHGLQLRDKFARAGYSIIKTSDNDFTGMSYAYRR